MSPGGQASTSYGAMTEDTATVVNAAGVSAPIVVGHSLGGLVATAYTSGHDVRAVVNVDLSLDTPANRSEDPDVRVPPAQP